MTKPSSGDHRWLASILLTITGATTVVLTFVLRGDTWADFIGTGAYSIGWALLTFGVLYLLTKKFENWEWGRPDHDLAEIFRKELDRPDDN